MSVATHQDHLAIGRHSSLKPPEMRYTATPRAWSAPISSLAPCTHTNLVISTHGVLWHYLLGLLLQCVRA